jgi:23S rRNA (guanosine2251-2'-O)-methyltransferase
MRGRRRVIQVWQTDAPGSRFDDAGREVPVSRLPRHDLEELCGSPDHQGIVAEVDPYPYVDAERLLEPEQALVVALDQIQDPQNLGAICRSVECAGVAGVVVPERRAASVTAAVCKASAGAVEHLQIAQVRNLADFLARARELGAWIYGAAADAPQPYTAVDYHGRAVVVFGGEESGLRPRVRAACDALVSIPMHGRTASLNVSAAAAVVLFEALRQRAGA